MITFKSPEDLSKLSPTDPAYPLISELVESLIVAYTQSLHDASANAAALIQRACQLGSAEAEKKAA